MPILPKPPSLQGPQAPRPIDYDDKVRAQQANDPMWKKVGRNAVDALGDYFTGDPFADKDPRDVSIGSKIGMLASALPAGMISIYKSAAARKLATEGFLESAKRMGIPNLDVAAQGFASKYPRVAAHLNISPEVASKNTVAQIALPTSRIQKPLNMAFSDPGRAMIDQSVGVATDALHHEGTHAAQMLGNKRAASLYSQAENVVGYEDNPFEVNARRAGNKSIGNPVGSYTNVIPQLREIASEPQGLLGSLRETITGKTTPKEMAKTTISSILDKRAKTPIK